MAVALLMSFQLGAQNLVTNGNLESWTADVPDNWSHVENITQESTIVYEGTYSARHQSASGTQDFGHETITGIVAGGTYILSYYYFDNDENAKTRIWSKWQDASGAQIGDAIQSDYSVDSPDWQHYNESLIAPVGATQFYLEVRVYKENAEGGYVYYDDFSFVYDASVYPEPSNYPTEFAAATSGLSIELTWVDAVGSQLPSGYLILGEKDSKSIDLPVDGVPVADDLDWSDGSVAVNVSYAQLSYIFNDMEGSSSYTFAIYPYTNTGSDIDYKTDGNAPTVSAETSNISQLLNETFDNDLGVWMQYSVTGDQIWEWDSYGLPPGCAKMSGFAGSANENQDWLISPGLDMLGYNDLTFSFDHARNYASNDGLYVMISSDYSGSGDPSVAEWSDITSEFVFPETGTWDFASAGEVDITEYASENVYLAFVYNSNNTDAATWEIDNTIVLGVVQTGIDNNESMVVSLYPNPAKDMIMVNTDEEANLSVCSLTGQKIIETSVSYGDNQVDVSKLQSGIYMVVTVGKSGNKSVTKLEVK